jgi:hypothetical protein
MLGQNQASSSSSTRGAGFITEGRPDLWRASKLTGLNVYNENGEKIGDINEVLVDRDGKAEAVVIGVGGFLGLGERDVAVAFNALRWEMNDRTAANSGAAGTGGASRTGTAGTTATTANPSSSTGTGTVSTTGSTALGTDSSRGYPDRVILPNASKDQLKEAPQFRYGAR